MALVMKQLAQGQLPDSTGDLYTAPEGKSALLKTVTVVNTHTATETVNLYVKPAGGSARRLIPKDLQLKAGYLLVVDDELTLEAGDKLQGAATTASKLDYTVSGVEDAS